MGKVGEEFRYQEVRDKLTAVVGHKAWVRSPVPKDEAGIQEMGIQTGAAWDWKGKKIGAEEK